MNVREDFSWSSKVMLNIKQIDGIYVLLCKKKKEKKRRSCFCFFKLYILKVDSKT